MHIEIELPGDEVKFLLAMIAEEAELAQNDDRDSDEARIDIWCQFFSLIAGKFARSAMEQLAGV